MNSRILKHSLFWIAIMFFLTIYFGRASQDYTQSLYFTTFLLPVALGTSYLFNYYLVPFFLVPGRYLKFSLYCFYTLVISIYLEMLVITLSFIVLANYEYDKLNPLTVDIYTLTITIYTVVLGVAFVRMFKFLQLTMSNTQKLQEEKEKSKVGHLSIKANRKTVPIPINQILFIESLSDYVKIHTNEKVIMSKEKISKIQDELPAQFIRVHRSFIVNQQFIDSFNKEKIVVSGTEIPISRTYKKDALEQLGGNGL
ncbi:MAG: LytTR family transcriptional regulator [Cyclobacteriaceae bacterium]